MSIKIILADDHKIMRDGLRALLEKQFGMKIVGEAENGRETVRLVRETKPDVVIMDISMPDLNGIDATRQILADAPGVKIIALSMHSDHRFVTGILGAGACGYLLKDCAFEELERAVRTVTENKIYLSSGITKIVVEDYLNRIKKSRNLSINILSPREREVLQLLAEGKNNRQISSHLNLSVKTVESHRRQIMKKLKINTIAGLTKYAIREGLTSLDT